MKIVAVLYFLSGVCIGLGLNHTVCTASSELLLLLSNNGRMCARVCDGGNLVDFEIMEHPGLVEMLFRERAKLSEAPGKIPRQTMNEVMKIRIVESRKKEERGVGDAERRW